MAKPDDDGVSPDLAGFTDPETDEAERWSRLERDALLLCDPLARMIGHKRICAALDVSKGQLSRELSPNYENNLALRTALYIGSASQNDKLARVIVCDGLGMRMSEWQRRRPTAEEELRALKAEVRARLPHDGEAILEAATRRARGDG